MTMHSHMQRRILATAYSNNQFQTYSCHDVASTSPDLHSIDNLWNIIKRQVYVSGLQLFSIWAAISKTSYAKRMVHYINA